MSRARPLRLGAAAFAACAALALSACKGCRSERPYTPFGMASSLPSAPPSVVAAPSASAPEVLEPRFETIAAPKNATKVRIGPRELESPAGRVFDQLLSSDPNLDNHLDVFAFTRPAPDAPADASPGEVYFYANDEPAKRVLDWPSFLPSGPSCTSSGLLSQHTLGALTVDLRANCTTQLVARAPTRAVVVLDPRAPTPFLFGVRAADPAPGETLAVDVWSKDIDDDRRADRIVRVSVTTRPNEYAVPIEFVWFDRAAGESRETRRTSRLLQAELDPEVARAKTKQSAAKALRRLESARRSLFSACAESGTPRVFDWEGAPLSCELTADVIDRLGAIDVSGRLNEGDLAGAVSALARDGWYFGALRPQRRVTLIGELEKKFPPIPVTTQVLDLTLKTAARPHYSPLSFEADGALLAQTSQGVERVPPGEGRATPLPADAPSSAWPLDVVLGPDRLSGAIFSCDRSEIQLLLTGAGARTLPTSLLAPRPGVCRGGTVPDPIPLAPISAGDSGIEAVLAGARVHTGTPQARVPRGSARSENGKALVLSTPLGLVVSGDKTELWKIEGWPVAPGSDCVVTNDARRAACVRANRTEIYTR